MNFQKIHPIGTADTYLDVAFKKAKNRMQILKQKQKKKRPTIGDLKNLEKTRFNVVKDTLTDRLLKSLKSFPEIDKLPPFYNELIKTTLDYPALKKSLGALNWAVKKVKELHRFYILKINKTQSFQKLNSLRREFYGRISSVPKQIKKELHYLEHCRKVMRTYPNIKPLPTIAIAGFPNVGKTTLLKAITKSEPKIASYPFTTQKLMLGYLTYKNQEIQFIDTPGLLDRPLEKRNPIELQAILALKYLTKTIIFVLDSSDYVDKQIKLLHEITKAFPDIPIVVALNKVDIADKEVIEAIKSKLKSKKIVEISAEKEMGIAELIKFVLK